MRLQRQHHTHRLTRAKKTLCVLFVLSQVFVMYMFWKWSKVKLVQYCQPQAQTRLGVVSQAQSRDRWIITSFYTGSDVIDIPGWTVLFFGVTDASVFCRFSDCVILNSVEDEKLTQDENDKWLPKKTRAYLHAISHGAKVICVARHLDTGTIQLIRRMTDNMPESGMMLMSNKTFIRPHEIFNNVKIAATKYYNDFFIEKRLSALILSSFSPSQGETTQGKQSRDHDLYPPVFLPINTYTSLSTHVNVFRYDAFWALFLRDTGNGDMIIQRLLWEITGHIGIYPSSTSERTGTTINKPVNVPPALLSWKCIPGLKILECLENVMTTMAEELQVTVQDLYLINKWISELKSIKYRPPQRDGRAAQPLKKAALGIAGTQLDRTSVNSQSRKQLQQLCPTSVIRFPKQVIDDIALIITFNVGKFYSNINILEAMYRPYFATIIYCGPNLTKFKKHIRVLTTPYFIFIEAFKRGWYFMFECTVEAMKLNIGVKGFLQIGDDTLINPWNINTQPRDKIWLHTGFNMANASLEELVPRWGFWKYKPNMLAVIDEIKNMSEFKPKSSFESRFLLNYRNNSQNFTYFFIQSADFMYMPMAFKHNYTIMANLLLKHTVMVEIGFVNVAFGLQMWENIHFVKNGSLYGLRSKYRSFYSVHDLYLHPFKLQRHLARQSGRHFFCEIYLNDTFRI
ncbi:probable glycosyltransferase STELLO1 [Haliotis rubra]|uniref:probable glycosyltransferase STELLO1 n=1 Tax=Haliotis rubra TaxID=36100 RepID=UPI001EE57168|nr:probable glycosyltransferase STELLO1 [Haliotis rubra]